MSMEDIAVIGLGLRFPGEATSPEALWDVLEKGRSQWSEIPRDRLNIDGYYHPGGQRQGSISFKGAHFLAENVANFDAPFFSIGAVDAKAIDPQQRFLLEVCYEALENAGCTKESIDGTDTSVYVGSFVKDYEQICLRDPDWQPQYAATGNGIAIMANRISYFFNLHGPSMTIDTGCSGSLVSVHLAVQSLRTGESSLAIAAGAGLILTPNTIMPMTALNFLSPDGKCFTFDSRANGYGRGEGVGAVILKRMSDAIRDNDTIRAVIRATRVNQDGRTTGITLPSKEAQVANIRAVYNSASLCYSDTAYVECHGTGTQAGDWRELKAISETLGSSRSSNNPILVGSVKPNIGHLEGAAGIAGLIKAVLMLERQRIPPHINFETPNPDIDFADWKVQVTRTGQDWPLNQKKRVSVNCFGFGGTNAHVILDGAAEYLSTKQLSAHHSSPNSEATMTSLSNVSHSQLNGSSSCDSNDWQIFCFSAHEQSGILRMAQQHLDMLERRQLASDFLPNYAYTLGCRRSQLEWKTFYLANSTLDLKARLKESESTVKRHSKDSPPKLCFLFSGQGSQWARMGLELRSYPAFWSSLNSASWYMKTFLGSSFDLVEEISRYDTDSLLAEPQISQPATTAIQVALVDLMRSFSIEPDFVVGHSSGEIAAAFACGVISREEAWELAFYRGLAAIRLKEKIHDFCGGMIAVSMTPSQAADYILTINHSLEIACINSPSSITLSGKRDTIEQVSRHLKAKGIQSRPLSVKMAYHSSYMKKVEDEYVRDIASVCSSGSRTLARMFSSVTGAEIHDYQKLDASYWGRNMASTVKYSSAIESLMALPDSEKPSFFVEMGPSTVLRTPTLATLPPLFQGMYLSALDKRRPGMASVLDVAGSLWASGYRVNLKSVISRRTPHIRLRCLPDLPAYPWNHTKSYWHESHLSLANRFRQYGRLDLIGAPTADSIPFEPRWRGFLRISENPWMQDHQIQKTIIYPAAGVISMVLEGARQLKKDEDADIIGYEIREVHLDKAITIADTEHGVEVALNMRAETTGPNQTATGSRFSFSLYSKGLDKSWEKHVTGTLCFCFTSPNWEARLAAFDDEHDRITAVCPTPVSPRQLYEHLDTVGISYGPMFRNIIQVTKGDNSCVSKIRVPDTRSKMPAGFEYPHLLHPATLDSMFQTLFALQPIPKIPCYIQSIFVSRGLDLSSSREFTGHATASTTGGQSAEAHISMCCTDRPGDQVIIKGLRFTGNLFPGSTHSSFLPNHRTLATQIVWRQDPGTAVFASFRHALSLLSHKHPNLTVLQIGASLTLTKSILLSCAQDTQQPPRLSKCTLTGQDESNPELDDLLTSSFKDCVEVAPHMQEIQSQYHLIIISEESENIISKAEHLLNPGGTMILLDSTGNFCDNPQSIQTEKMNLGWEMPELHREWLRHAKKSSCQPTANKQLTMRRLSTIAGACNMPDKVVLLLPLSVSSEVWLFKDSLHHLLSLNYPTSEIVALSLQDAATCNSLPNDTLFISLLEFSSDVSIDGFVFDWTESSYNAFHKLQKMMKKVIWVTRSASMQPTNPRAAAIIGLARTLMSEDLQIRFVTFDLSNDASLSDVNIVDLIFTVCRDILDPTLSREAQEMDFAEKDGKLYIPRLEPLHFLNRLVEQVDEPVVSAEDEVPFPTLGVGNGQSRFELANSTPELPTSADLRLYLMQSDLEPIGSQQVQISPSTAVLHSRCGSLGSQQSHFYDVVGHVTAAGHDVERLQSGDKVVALIPTGRGICTTLQIDLAYVLQYRPGFVPSHFLAAYHALFNAGRLGRGATVLVQNASTGLELAAVELALICGAKVLVTVAGKAAIKQGQLLQKRGVRREHILDGNDDGCLSVIDLLTKKQGVDLVYNPTQQNLGLSIACIRSCGTVVHFAGTSDTSTSAVTCGKPVTIISFDLNSLLTNDGTLAVEMLHAAAQMTSDVSLDWMSDSTINWQFNLTFLQDASEECSRHDYPGSVSVLAAAESEDGQNKVHILKRYPTRSLGERISQDLSYVLVGGLGGLGRSIAQLLVANGAKHITFLSRSGASSNSSSRFLQDLTLAGVNAKAFAIDVCNKKDFQYMLETDIGNMMPPIGGVFHCAAVIKDSVFENMTHESWEIGFNPKALGAWNLVQSIQATGQSPFYVFLASSAGVIGTRGQANYAAANSFLDSLARSLRLQGQQAVSLDLGPILGAGMLAEDEAILDILRASGFYGIRLNDFLTIMKHAIMMETIEGESLPPQVVLGVGTGGLLLQNQPADPYWSRTALYSYLNIVDLPEAGLKAPSLAVSVDIKSQLANCVDAEVATGVVCSGLSTMLAKSLNITSDEIDTLRPPSSYGVDSLIAVGVRNWVAGHCAVEISVFEVMSELTVLELSRLIVQKGGFGRPLASSKI